MAALSTPVEIVYPDSDGQPMADNTLQFEWIMTLMGNLDAQFADNPSVFVAGDLLWYPVEGHPEVRAAPDTMVIFGRPKGYRGSYRQWEEGGIAPQAVFEILSPGNTVAEMLRKLAFYDRYGVEEVYYYDPQTFLAQGWRRTDGALQLLPDLAGWISPRLGIRFVTSPDAPLVLYRADGTPFRGFVEQSAERDALSAERDALSAERDAARTEAERLRARLRALGVEA